MVGGVSLRRGVSMAGDSEGAVGRCYDGARDYELFAGRLGCVSGRLAVLVGYGLEEAKAADLGVVCEWGVMLSKLATDQRRRSNKAMFVLDIMLITLGSLNATHLFVC